MRKEKFLKSFYALLLLVAGMGFVACSEEPIDGPGSNGNEDVTASKPGDDFYMYVNGEWFKSIGNEDVNKGWMVDVDKSIKEKTEAVLEEMEAKKTLDESFRRLKNGEQQQANVEFVDELYGTLSAEIMAAEDIPTLGRLCGKYITNGYLDCMMKLYTAVSPDDDRVCFTIVPDPVFAKLMSSLEDEEGEEEGEEEESRTFGKHLNFSTGVKYFSKTRAAGEEDFFTYVVEGLGADFDPDLFVKEDSLSVMYDQLLMCPLEDLQDFVLNAVRTELYLYCGDQHTQEVTSGVVATTEEIMEKLMPELFMYPLSYYFCEKYVSDETKEKFTAYAESLREVFAKRIEANAWLSATTKAEALTKLANMKFFIGEPDSWIEEGLPQLRGNLLADDLLEMKQARISAIRNLVGENVKEETMNLCILGFGGIPTYIYNAFHFFMSNSVVILPAFMMEPEYTPGMDVAKMYAMFYVIGHEFTHGFDVKGSQYDLNGLEHNWWDQADREKFDALNKALIEQISTFEILPGVMADGNKTVGEDVADLGGLNIALDALTEYLTDQNASDEEIKEAHKTFFEYYALRYRSSYSQEQIQKNLQDVHSFDKVRVNGIFQHIDRWYELYDVNEGDKLYLPAEERITIW